ncbi:MAG: hypothetical protein IT302_01485 [Dehalococcoidia bacterium]|nr:hypothetical protein [Dehalococcoidia bacterium]
MTTGLPRVAVQRCAAASVACAALLFVAACGGQAQRAAPTATPAAQPARPTPAFTVVLPGISSGSSDITGRGGLPPACAAGALELSAGSPVGATAMMTLSLTIRNTAAACTLRPLAIRFDGDTGTFAASDWPRPALSIPADGRAYITLVWSWKANAEGPCARREPPAAEAVIALPIAAGADLRAPITIALAPCDATLSILDSGLVP